MDKDDLEAMLNEGVPVDEIAKNIVVNFVCRILKCKMNTAMKIQIVDKSLILKNRSIYKTLSNGDIVLNKEVAGTVTWDTPRCLVNENKCIV